MDLRDAGAELDRILTYIGEAWEDENGDRHYTLEQVGLDLIALRDRIFDADAGR